MISRPTTNFCRLPPESWRGLRIAPGPRTSKLASILSARRRAGPESDDAAAGDLAGRVMGGGSRSRSGGASAPRHGRAAPRARRRRRSAGGRRCRPARRRGPPIATLAAAGASRSPEIAANSSLWPLPAMPAMPRISPFRTVKPISFRVQSCGSAEGRGQAAHRERLLAGRRLAMGLHLADLGSRPSGPRCARALAAARVGASRRPGRCAERSAVRHSRRTSSSLCEM